MGEKRKEGIVEGVDTGEKRKENKRQKEQKPGNQEPGGKSSEPVKEKRKSKKKKYVIIGIFFILFILLAAGGYIYYRGVTFYSTHFFPNTNINGIDCSDQEAAFITEALDSRIEGYALAVIGRDYKTGESGAVIGVVAPGDIRLGYTDSAEAVTAFLQEQNEFRWIEAYLDGEYSYSLERDVVFDQALLESAVRGWEACKSDNMQAAENAYISEYSEESGGYEIISETSGTEFDVDAAIAFISEAVSEQEASVDLEELGCYQEASIRSDDRGLNSAVETANKWLGTKIVYDWNGTEVVLDRELLKDWISMEDGRPRLDEEAVADYVKEQADAYDTYGKKKNFMTTHGFEVTLSNRSYGWKTDMAGEAEELRMLIYQGSTIEKEPLYSITARHKGTDDLGDSYVEADLSNQHLYLYQDGEIVLETDFVSGTMASSRGCVTPEGIFGITYKTMNAVLKGATYRTPVKYWMPFYGNYGMHDANWRSAFGGEIFKTNGSHGCINLPPSMAEQIYQYVSQGFPVVCYYSQGIPYVGPAAVPEPGEGIPQEQVYPEEMPPIG